MSSHSCMTHDACVAIFNVTHISGSSPTYKRVVSRLYHTCAVISNLKKKIEQIQLTAKLLDYFLWSNKSKINRSQSYDTESNNTCDATHHLHLQWKDEALTEFTGSSLNCATVDFGILSPSRCGFYLLHNVEKRNMTITFDIFVGGSANPPPPPPPPPPLRMPNPRSHPLP